MEPVIDDKWSAKYYKTLTGYFENDEIYTVNDMYIHTRYGTRRNDGVVSTQNQTQEQVDTLSDEDVRKIYCYTMDLVFLADKSFWVTKGGDVKRKDISNLIKPVEDGLTRAIGVDDSKCIDIKTRKVVNTDKRLTIPPYVILYQFHFFTRIQ